MAEAKSKKKTQNSSPLIGAQAVPTTLDKTVQLDIDTTKQLSDNIIEAGVSGGLNVGELENFTAMANSRDQMYQLIDTMSADSTVSSIIRTYAEDVCETSDNGHIMWCESDDPKISLFVNYLLNVMNVDKNLFKWAYNLIKYGDIYLKLYRKSDYKDSLFKQETIDQVNTAHGQLRESVTDPLDESVKLSVHTATDPYSYYVEMVADPNTMFELTKFGQTYGYIETPNERQTISYATNMIQATDSGNALAFNNYKMKTNDINIYQADDFVHGCLDDNYTRYPETVDIFSNTEDYSKNANASTYQVHRGKSMLYDSYKVWREKQLLETSILLNRLTKSSIVRNIQVEVGDMGKAQTRNTLRSIKALFEQKSGFNAGVNMSEYNNPGPIENNIFTATHNGQGAITVNAVGGDVDVKNIADLDWWNKKFFSCYGVPMQYFGWTDDAAGFNGGSSLSIISSTYAKGVKRVQNAIIQMVTDAINLFLVNRGCTSYLNNFVLKMKVPLSQEERDYRDDLTNRISAISSMQSLFSEVDSKPHKLTILKSLIKTLNYGDELLQVLDEEINEAKRVQEEEKAAAEAQAAAEAKAAQDALADESDATDLDDGLENDLGLTSEVALEDLSGAHSQNTLAEDLDFITEDDDLPSPEDLKQDFTTNK